jgi:hypothetical protein
VNSSASLKYFFDELGGLYGISPDHPVLPVLPSSKAAEEDLYARFQLLLCPSAAAADNKTNSSGGSKASSGPNVASSNTSPFSTLTGAVSVAVITFSSFSYVNHYRKFGDLFVHYDGDRLRSQIIHVIATFYKNNFEYFFK